MPVKPIALALAAGAQRGADARERQREAERQREERERQKRAADLMERMPLHEWFPDTTFEIIAYTGVGTSLQYVSNGSDIIVESDDGVLFGVSDQSGDISVSVVELVQPSKAYAHEGPYYSGRLVEDATDVGVWLESRV